MATRNTLEVLKQCFEEVVPRHDKRTTIAPLSFVVCLVYTYLGDSKTFSPRSDSPRDDAPPQDAD